MSQTTNKILDEKQNKQWHYDHCELDREDDRDSGTTMWCIKHEIDVTECMPDFDYEPDLYDESEANLNA
jgi:hypothetical protein